METENVAITYDLAWAEDNVIDTKKKKALVSALKQIGFKVTDSDFSSYCGREYGYVELSRSNIYIYIHLDSYEENNGDYFCEDSITYVSKTIDTDTVLWRYGQKFHVKNIIEKIKKLFD